MAIIVEVVFALPEKHDLSTVRLAAGATLGDALDASGVMQRNPEIRKTSWQFGIFGKAAGPEVRLADGDRVEIYRPLALDPKEARRRRAISGKNKRSV